MLWAPKLTQYTEKIVKSNELTHLCSFSLWWDEAELFGLRQSMWQLLRHASQVSRGCSNNTNMLICAKCSTMHWWWTISASFIEQRAWYRNKFAYKIDLIDWLIDWLGFNGTSSTSSSLCLAFKKYVAVLNSEINEKVDNVACWEYT